MTTVGTCTDCIISVPNNSPLSLKYTVSIDQGINHVIKHRGTVNGYYPSNNVNTQNLQVAVSSSYSPLQATSSLVIQTSSPLQVTLKIGTQLIVLTVSQLLIIDQPLTSFMLTNQSTTQIAYITLAFTD